MPSFELHRPETAADAARLAQTLDDSMFVAGGTDLLVNLKHQLHQPEHLISLDGLSELREITAHDDGSWSLGAGVTLHRIAGDERLPRGLREAAGSVAGPQHRRMGTLGGNVMLDTRCLYYNQSEGWREALGYCLKAEGTWCHVIGSRRTCVAASSCDTPPVLIALGAELVFLKGEETVVVPISELYQQDGRYDRNHSVPRSALLTRIRIPAATGLRQSIYRKVRAREAVDYPQLGVAIALRREGGRLSSLDVVVSAVLPKPRPLKRLARFLGRPLSEETIREIAEEGFSQVRPQRSIHGSPEWRRHMARVEIERGLQALASAGE